MTLLSSINGDLSLLWRLAFGLTALLGVVEILLYLSTGGTRTRGPTVLRACSLGLYALIAVFALRPTLAMTLGPGLAPRESEAILVTLLVVVGVNLAWLGLTESSETAGA